MQEIILLVLGGEVNKAANLLTNELERNVTSYLYRNYGVERNDARSILNVAIVITFDRIRKENEKVKKKEQEEIEITIGFVFGVCKKLGLEYYRKDKKYTSEIESYTQYVQLFYNDAPNQNRELFYKALNLLDDNCKKLIKLRIEGCQYKDIIEQFPTRGSADSLRQLFPRCMKKLRKIIEDLSNE